MSTNVNRRNLIKQVLTGSAAIATGAVVPSNILAAVKNNTITEHSRETFNIPPAGGVMTAFPQPH